MQCWFQNTITTTTRRQNQKYQEEKRSIFQSSIDIYKMSEVYYLEVYVCEKLLHGSAGIILISKVSESLNFVSHPLMLIFISS